MEKSWKRKEFCEFRFVRTHNCDINSWRDPSEHHPQNFLDSMLHLPLCLFLQWKPDFDRWMKAIFRVRQRGFEIDYVFNGYIVLVLISYFKMEHFMVVMTTVEVVKAVIKKIVILVVPDNLLNMCYSGASCWVTWETNTSEGQGCWTWSLSALTFYWLVATTPTFVCGTCAHTPGKCLWETEIWVADYSHSTRRVV